MTGWGSDDKAYEMETYGEDLEENEDDLGKGETMTKRYYWDEKLELFEKELKSICDEIKYIKNAQRVLNKEFRRFQVTLWNISGMLEKKEEQDD